MMILTVLIVTAIIAVILTLIGLGQNAAFYFGAGEPRGL